MKRAKSLLLSNALLIITATAVFVQFIGRYHAHHYTVGHFYYSWILLRIIVPLVVITILQLPFSRLGLNLPKLDRFLMYLCLVSLAALFAIYLVIHASPRYLGYYAGGWGALDSRRLANFMIFTLSTLTGWEFLHRSFLLLGIFYVLRKRNGLDASLSGQIAIGTVWVFEVLFHFIKPQMEAAGMLLGSPLLSAVTLRTGSIWPAFFIHLGVEIVFILSF